MAGRDAVVRELMSLVGLKYQAAKKLLALSAEPAGTFRKIGNSQTKRSMSSQEAKRIVDRARERIRLVDEGG